MTGRVPSLRALPWVAALLGLIGVVALLLAQLGDEGSKIDGTTLGFTGLGLALLFAVAAPIQIGAALGRITTFKVGSVELGLAEVTQVERVKPLPGEDDGVGVSRRPRTLNAVTDYTEVVKQLTSRLRFVWMILHLEPTGVDKRDYVSVTTELHRRDLLTDEEKRFIVDMLGRDPLEAKAWPAPTRSEFLDSAWAFATRFGPFIFANIDAISGRRIVIPDIREASGAVDGVQIIRLSALRENPNRAFD